MKRQKPFWFTIVVFTVFSAGLTLAQVPTISSFSPTIRSVIDTLLKRKLEVLPYFHKSLKHKLCSNH